MRIFGAASFKERVSEEQRKKALYQNTTEIDDTEMLDLTQMETVRQETCLQDSEILLQKLIASFSSDKSNIVVLGKYQLTATKLCLIYFHMYCI